MFPMGPTSAGEVNMKTGSGSTGLHGEAFGLFRDKSIAFAKAPGGQDLPFRRTDFGGKLGGTLIQDKAFFFLDVEHVTQDAHRAVVLPSPFQAETGSFSSPFRNTSASGKLDWRLRARPMPSTGLPTTGTSRWMTSATGIRFIRTTTTRRRTPSDWI